MQGGGQTLQSIGKYRVMGVLGRGSMGVVYKGEDPEIGRTVAIKTLRRITSNHFHDADAALLRFKNEARSAGQLRHPNIITVFDVNIEGDIPYIVMDYVEGDSLDIVLSKSGRLDVKTTLHYLSQVAAGLDAAHKHGVIHRDIKPSNLLVDPSGRVFVLDFGVAKINESFSDAQKVVKSEPVMGTPGYMSPEQVLNENLDARSDLFSLAIVAFECLTGRRPFPGANFTEIVGNILKGKPLSLTELAPDLPLALEVEFEKALSRKRDQRFDSASELVAALASAAGVDPAATSRVTEGRAETAARQGRPRRMRKHSEWKSITPPRPGPEISEEWSKSPPEQSGGRRRRKTTGGWGRLSRAQQTQDVDSYALAVAPGMGNVTEPGQIFAHGDNFFGSIGGAGRYQGGGAPSQRSPFKLVAGLAATAGIVFGVALFVMNYNSKPLNLPKVTPASAASTTLSGAKAEKSGVVLPVDAITNTDIAPVPRGKLVQEMSDAELLGILVNDEVPEAVVLSALRAAHERGIPKFMEASMKALDNDSYVVRVETIKLVAKLGDRRIVPKLVSKLDDHDAVVRRHAAEALGTLGSRGSLGYLSSRYLKEVDPRVKSAIKLAIERINGFPMQGQ